MQLFIGKWYISDLWSTPGGLWESSIGHDEEAAQTEKRRIYVFLSEALVFSFSVAIAKLKVTL